MKILGISGGMDRLFEDNYSSVFHDASAVLIVDGNIVAAIEEERLNRIKHTTKAPESAIRFCLETGDCLIDEIDIIAINITENNLDYYVKLNDFNRPERKTIDKDIRSYYQRFINEVFNFHFALEKIVFVPHHLAHAVSAYYMSGYDESLVFTIDGQGDGISGRVWTGHDNQLEPLQTYPESDSLGFFYNEVIKYLGYSSSDEYKVMGLAPYGDPRKYRRLFKYFYSLLSEGQYKVHFDKIPLLYRIMLPKKKQDPFTQLHKDIAASLQEVLEEIVFHVLNYFKEKTGHQRLCLAGGVAQNCTLNGKILYSNLFEEVFVQPAAHDAGSALGAALYVYHDLVPIAKRNKLEHLYWGTDIGSPESIEQTLIEWKDWLDFEKMDNVAGQTAKLLSEGKVIGWVQGRSEFGPRALGNRSIVADPRPSDNREIINEMVKLREGYRPFAPSVLEEYASEYYEMPLGQSQFPYMIFVLKVKGEKQKLLGAVTHIDGSARVQTVSRHVNSKYWELINAFRELTDIPILLNTSFNNNVEPIVDSVYDSIVCFLTTKLHHLIVGDYLISKEAAESLHMLPMILSLPQFGFIKQSKRHTSKTTESIFYEIGCSYSEKYNMPLSSELYHILLYCDGNKSIHSFFQDNSIPDVKTKELLEEVLELWSKRLIILHPNKNDRRKGSESLG
jgi:carbamoyltransferase